jgi:hypothetical protein
MVATLNPTIKKNVNTNGMIAKFSIVAMRRFHIVEADSISDALRRAIKQITDITLTSDMPIVENMLTADDVALNVLLVVNVLLVMLIMDDSK